MGSCKVPVGKRGARLLRISPQGQKSHLSCLIRPRDSRSKGTTRARGGACVRLVVVCWRSGQTLTSRWNPGGEDLRAGSREGEEAAICQKEMNC